MFSFPLPRVFLIVKLPSWVQRVLLLCFCRCGRCHCLLSTLSVVMLSYPSYKESVQPALSQPFMVKPTERKQNGGEAFHIGDCQMWMEIDYLDSPTDYREDIPQNRSRPLSCDYIRLDSSRCALGSAPKRVWNWAAPALLFVAAWLFMYLTWESS